MQRTFVIALLLAAGGGLLGVGALVLLRGAGPANAPCVADAGGWTGAGGGPTLVGAVPVALGSHGAGWAPAWASSAAAGPNAITAPPAMERGTLFAATADGALVALDAQTGAEQWRNTPDAAEAGAVSLSVALDGCSALVVSHASGGTLGVVRGVEVASHATKWATGISPAGAIAGAPEIVRGVGFVAVAQGTPSAPRFSAFGLNLGDGGHRFDITTTVAVQAPVSSDGSRLFITTVDGAVSAYDLNVGEGQPQRVWTVSGVSAGSVGPMNDGSRIVAIAPDQQVRALDPGDGHELWRITIGAPATAAPVETAGTIVVATGTDVVALDAGTGSQRWHSAATEATSGLAAGSDAVIVAAGSTLRVLDASDGHERSRWTAPAPIVGSPAVSGSTVAVACADGRVFGLPA